MQVETIRVVQALPGILEVDGVDGVFIGPSDLSASMGHIGNARHPDVVKVIREILQKTRAAGKAAGILVLDPAQAREYRDCGANMIGIGTDTLLLANSAQQLANSVKKRESLQSVKKIRINADGVLRDAALDEHGRILMDGTTVGLEETSLLPVTDQPVICVALNYAEHYTRHEDAFHQPPYNTTAAATRIFYQAPEYTGWALEQGAVPGLRGPYIHRGRPGFRDRPAGVPRQTGTSV